MSLGEFKIWEIHPSLVHFPIAFLLGGVVLDLLALRRRREAVTQAACWLLVAGVVTGVLTAAAGLVAFFTIPASHTEEAHSLMLWHLGLMAASVVLFTGVAIARWRRRSVPAAVPVWVAGLIAAVLLIAGGYVGGHIVYHGGAGIDPKIIRPQVGHGHAE